MSLYFNGVQGTSLQVANNAAFRFGTGDFTVEFFQKVTVVANTRIFSFGKFPSATFAFALGGASSGYQIAFNGTFRMSTNSSGYDWVGNWRHVAISRSSGTLRFFIDGNLVETVSSTDDFTDAINPLYIGGELNSDYSSTIVNGWITNFRWVSGTGLYTASFPKPTVELSPVTNTKLLLLSQTSGSLATDSGPLGLTVTNTSVTWSSDTPVSPGLKAPVIEDPPYVESQSITYWWGFTDITGVSSVYVRCVGPNGGSNYMPVTARQQTFNNLINTSSYTGIIQSVASSGISTTEVTYTAVKPGVAPSAPLNVVISKSGSSAVVSWDPPASDGGSDIKWYALQSTDLVYTFSIEPYKRTFTSTSIADGTYTFVLYAVNYVDWGTASAGTVLTFP